jgi:hypothetical protein
LILGSSIVGRRSVDDLLIGDRRLRPEALPVTEPG